MFGISDYGAFVAAFVLLLFLPGPARPSPHQTLVPHGPARGTGALRQHHRPRGGARGVRSAPQAAMPSRSPVAATHAPARGVGGALSCRQQRVAQAGDRAGLPWLHAQGPTRADPVEALHTGPGAVPVHGLQHRARSVGRRSHGDRLFQAGRIQQPARGHTARAAALEHLDRSGGGAISRATSTKHRPGWPQMLPLGRNHTARRREIRHFALVARS